MNGKRGQRHDAAEPPHVGPHEAYGFLSVLRATPIVSRRDVEQLGTLPRQRVHQPDGAERQKRTHDDDQECVGGPAGPPIGRTAAIEMRRDERRQLPDGDQHGQNQPDGENPEEGASQP